MAAHSADNSIPIEDLLRHSQWLRPLAFRLLRDGDEADDAVQETYLAALRRPPAPSRDLASWLGGVLRNLCFQEVRRERRREARERRAARPEAAAATPDSLLERAELFRQVVEAVLALDEPYRSSVLLRFFDELPPREISRRQGVPIDTVNSRLRRALDKLRLRLDGARGGRAVWSAALAGWLGLELTAPAAASASATGAGVTGAALSKGAIGSNPLLKSGILAARIVMTQKMVLVSGVALMAALGAGVGIGAYTAHPRRDDGVASAAQLAAAKKKSQEMEARYSALLAQFQKLRKEKIAAEKARSAPGGAPAADPQATAAAEDASTLGLDLLREMIKSNDYKIEILTPQTIEETLEKNGRKASFLVAAALLSKDDEKASRYLEEALGKDPQSPAALSTAISMALAKGDTGERTRGLIETLKSSDPSNCLAGYFAAAMRLRDGDPAAALADLREAGARIHLQDYVGSNLSTSESFFNDAGASPGLSRAMATISSRMDALRVIVDLSEGIAQETSRRLDGGDPASAMPFILAQARLGNQVASSGHFMLVDVHGIRIENRALQAELKVLESAGQGQGERSQEIARRLALNAEQIAHMRSVADTFASLIPDLSESEVLDYMSRVSSEGEISALADLKRQKG
jgi:RNA polymerase sigma factor (sigma-70 family)